MNELLLKALLGLYPREWRKRYGGEVRELVHVLGRESRRSLLGMVASLIAGATVERIYRLRRFDRATLAAATVATVVALGGSSVLAHRLRMERGRPSGRAMLARSPGPAAGAAVVSRTDGRAARGRSTL